MEFAKATKKTKIIVKTSGAELDVSKPENLWIKRNRSDLFKGSEVVRTDKSGTTEPTNAISTRATIIDKESTRSRLILLFFGMCPQRRKYKFIPFRFTLYLDTR